MNETSWELRLCERCNTMTNHNDSICLKCNDTKDLCLTKEHFKLFANYIKQNVVPNEIKEAIIEQLKTEKPNVIQSCAEKAGWKKEAKQ